MAPAGVRPAKVSCHFGCATFRGRITLPGQTVLHVAKASAVTHRR